MEVVEANPDLAPILVNYAKECLDSGIPKYLGVEQNPEAYLAGLIERSKATSELPNGYLPSTTYYCVSNSEILGAIRVRKGTNANVDIVTCSIDNPASQKVIENCGGEYLGNYTTDSEGTVRRYRLART
ncbi:GNAT family N-acetyltransferase [Vibrio parahaemolyticus]|uniref:GNAT family N-acetyltransferase n=1 Tax=Vibrio parahaemolyticus TaxID=670 RepID=A0AA46UGG0_VIBPH|nr:acetyltransferase [Vibrio parahaemolyticus]EXJ40963.1 putative acetyltransferase [Vibrio parahaemolyticus VPTS-2010_2]MCC3850166.1 GNAT family N-acetyltransferase [Vibrio parahaemolyticus]UYV25266.1 GNAT family N-acetyltransferase [Vibrio parahaemolyticus]HCJ4876777.1 GNAT family N-acetyltransferase [Vibrio parahaemolyticus]